MYAYTQWVDCRVLSQTDGILMVIYRGAVAISVQYWALGHTVGYLAIGVVISESLVDYLYA